MYRFLTRPVWVLLALLVAAAAYVFVSLGFWQLDRRAERSLENTILLERSAAEPLPLELVLGVDDDIIEAGESHEYRRVTVTGQFDPAHEVLGRSQTNRDGEAGFHVITPFVLASGDAILVNQGWVPLRFDTPPYTDANQIPQTLTLTLAASRIRGGFGPQEPEGDLERIVRVDIERLRQQMPYALYPVYGILYETDGDVPERVEPAEVSLGPHLTYAIQWFAFAAISVIGFWALVRTRSRRVGTSPADGVASSE